jgi:hypothetical protein
VQLTLTLDASTETEAEFYARLARQPITILPRLESVNWGSGSGQGKRLGGGAVRGSMADPPRGVKTYRNRYAALPDYAEIRAEVVGLAEHEGARYLRARSAELCHEGAMRYVYEADPREAGVTWRWWKERSG